MDLKKEAKRYLANSYSNIRKRCAGKDPKRQNYAGLKVMEREAFYKWGMTPEFLEMYKTYIDSDKDRKLAPSVDRIDTTLGYVEGNLQWLTLSNNVKRRGGKEIKIPLFSFQIILCKY